MTNQIPINPNLPKEFDNTPNDARSTDELDRWWDHPYCVTTDNGQFDVRCLHGGAWDRSSWLGRVSTYAEACVLAEQKQAAWTKQRSKPIASVVDGLDGPCDVIRRAGRPDDSEEVLARCASMQEANDYIEKMNASIENRKETA